MNPQDWMKAAAQAATAEEPPTTEPVAAAPEPGAGTELATGSPTPPETPPAASEAPTPPSLPAAGGHPAFRTVAPSPATNQPEPQPEPQPATSRPTPTEDKPVFVDPFSDTDTPAADAPAPAGEQVNPFASLSQAAAVTPSGPEQVMVTPTPDAPAGSGPDDDFAGLFNDAPTPETDREATAPTTPGHTPPQATSGPLVAADPFAPLTGPGALPSATASTLEPSSVPSPPAVGYYPGLSYVIRGRAAEKLQVLADETSKDHGELVETAIDLLLMLRKLP